MVWFFEREGRFVRFETRGACEPGVYELVILDADGGERVEQFEDSDLLLQRQVALERYFLNQGWQGPFGRFL